MAELDQPVIKEWILGSSSQWRQAIFQREFGTATFAAADIDEKAIRHNDPEIMTQLIAKAKADEIIRRGDLELNDRILVCCDQVIRFRGEIREKPVSRDQCRVFLRSYMDHPNEFVECINGISVYYNGRFLNHFETSKLTFKNLTAEKVESLVALDDVHTCAGGFTVCHMEVGQLHGTIDGIEGLPVHMVRSLGSLCARLKIRGNITQCVVDLSALVNDTEPFDLRPGVEKMLNQLRDANIGLRLLSRFSSSVLEAIRTSASGKAVMKVFGENIVCDKTLGKDGVGASHAIVFVSDFDLVGEFVEAGMNVFVVGERSSNAPQPFCIQIDSFVNFNFAQFI